MSSQANIDLNNIQGDIIIGLQKRVEAFLFGTLKGHAPSIKNFRHHLKADLLPLITSTQDVIEAQRKIDDLKCRQKPGETKVLLPITQMNIGFTAAGLKKLGLQAAEIPGGAFGSGQAADAVANLGDPVDQNTKALSSWSQDFLENEIDFVLLLTAPNHRLLDEKLHRAEKIICQDVSSVFVRQGVVRPGAEAGHEHFGFLDGISFPQIEGINATPSAKKSGIVKPGVILLGEPDETGNSSLDPKQLWTKDGSFLAFRQLQQLVPEFQKFCDDSASKEKNITGELVGARIVGRWKSGTPIELAPTEDNPNLTGGQDFDYSDDLIQERCPYAAHIRKTNPRNGLNGDNPKRAVLPHLMVRNGIPYGPELTDSEVNSGKTEQDRGLLFVAYQSQLENGFQFVQKFWSNNINFPSKTPAKVTPGFDLLIGQTSDQQAKTASNIIPTGPNGNTDPNNVLISPRNFINPLGGEYFLMPSLEALRDKLGA